MLDLTSPATRGDVLHLLMHGARGSSVLRLLTSDMAQLSQGYSYVLRDGPELLGIAGFWPAPTVPDELTELARGRQVYVLWMIAGPGLPRAIKSMVGVFRRYVRVLQQSGALVIADIDTELESAPRLAQLMGLVPRQQLAGHDLWSSQ